MKAQELRDLALKAKDQDTFTELACELTKGMSVKELDEELEAQNAGCFETYYKNVRGE